MTTHHTTKPWLAICATTLVLLLSMMPVSAKDNGNAGTIKVHDEATADPPTRNEPHVDCEDFWVEGFNMKSGSGRLFVFSWPPTGDKELVMEGNWSADDGTPEHHFLAGPFTLPAGHYQVWASNGPSQAGDGPGQMKKKTFWVDACPTAEEPAPECPSDLAAVANDNGSVTLTFTPAEGSDGTNVYRATGDGDFEYLATADAGVATYADSSVQANQGYAYTVTGLFGDAESHDCPIVEATTIPDFPTTLGLGLATGGGVLAMALLGRRRKA